MAGVLRNSPRLSTPRRWPRAAGAGLLTLALSGCAVGPNFVRPAAPEADGFVKGKLASPDAGPGEPRVSGQHFVTGADVSSRWWAAFRSQPLDELVKQSVEHNPT